ncbi:MAG: phosphohydrolase [Desulfuromonas sp.]|nr:MAG: phosphohydrolase [Desulfuromonas sp.]
MEHDTARLLMQGVAGAMKGLRLYPLNHPAVGRQIDALWTVLSEQLRQTSPVSFGLLEGTLFVEEQFLDEDQAVTAEVVRLLKQLELEGVELHRDLDRDEIAQFIGLLGNGTFKGNALIEEVSRLNLAHIQLRTIEKEVDEKSTPPRKVYGRALKVVDNIFHDVRLGKIPSSTEAMSVVKEMAEMTISEPHALFALSMLKDYDNYTFTHSVNVSVIALTVGRACALSEEQLRILGLGALLHDLGKLKVDVAIITKPGKLTDDEFAEIRKHPRTGADLVSDMEGVTPEVIDIVLCHHLRYDRTGYPADEQGRSISPLADMAAIADTYDALITLRSYQRPMTPRKATQKLRELAGTVLHEDFCERFISSLGPYPVGSLVRLDNNEIGLVVRVGSDDPDAVQLKILFDDRGELLDDPPKKKLSGDEAIRIVAEVDPFVKGIDVTEYLG